MSRKILRRSVPATTLPAAQYIPGTMGTLGTPARARHALPSWARRLVRTEISTADFPGAVSAPRWQRGDGLLGHQTAGENPWQLLTARGALCLFTAISCARSQPRKAAAVASLVRADEVPVPTLLHSGRWSVKANTALEVVRHRFVVFFGGRRHVVHGIVSGAKAEWISKGSFSIFSAGSLG